MQLPGKVGVEYEVSGGGGGSWGGRISGCALHPKPAHPSKSSMNLTSTTHLPQPKGLFLSSELKKLTVYNSHLAINCPLP